MYARRRSPAPSRRTLIQPVFASVITFLLLQYGNQRLPGTRVMAYTYLVPSWVTVWDAALGRGFVAPTVQVGIGLTVVAMLMLLRR